MSVPKDWKAVNALLQQNEKPRRILGAAIDGIWVPGNSVEQNNTLGEVDRVQSVHTV